MRPDFGAADDLPTDADRPQILDLTESTDDEQPMDEYPEDGSITASDSESVLDLTEEQSDECDQTLTKLSAPTVLNESQVIIELEVFGQPRTVVNPTVLPRTLEVAKPDMLDIKNPAMIYDLQDFVNMYQPKSIAGCVEQTIIDPAVLNHVQSIVGSGLYEKLQDYVDPVVLKQTEGVAEPSTSDHLQTETDPYFIRNINYTEFDTRIADPNIHSLDDIKQTYNNFGSKQIQAEVKAQLNPKINVKDCMNLSTCKLTPYPDGIQNLCTKDNTDTVECNPKTNNHKMIRCTCNDAKSSEIYDQTPVNVDAVVDQLQSNDIFAESSSVNSQFKSKMDGNYQNSQTHKYVKCIPEELMKIDTNSVVYTTQSENPCNNTNVCTETHCNPMNANLFDNFDAALDLSQVNVDPVERKQIRTDYNNQSEARIDIKTVENKPFSKLKIHSPECINKRHNTTKGNLDECIELQTNKSEMTSNLYKEIQPKLKTGTTVYSETSELVEADINLEVYNIQSGDNDPKHKTVPCNEPRTNEPKSLFLLCDEQHIDKSKMQTKTPVFTQLNAPNINNEMGRDKQAPLLNIHDVDSKRATVISSPVMCYEPQDMEFESSTPANTSPKNINAEVSNEERPTIIRTIAMGDAPIGYETQNENKINTELFDDRGENVINTAKKLQDIEPHKSAEPCFKPRDNKTKPYSALNRQTKVNSEVPYVYKPSRFTLKKLKNHSESWKPCIARRTEAINSVSNNAAQASNNAEVCDQALPINTLCDQPPRTDTCPVSYRSSDAPNTSVNAQLDAEILTSVYNSDVGEVAEGSTQAEADVNPPLWDQLQVTVNAAGSAQPQLNVDDADDPETVMLIPCYHPVSDDASTGSVIVKGPNVKET